MEAWGTKAKTPHIFRKPTFFGLAAFGGKAQKLIVSSKCMVFWPWSPRPPKNHLANKPIRDPFEIALESPSGADFGCNRHCKTNPVDLEGSRGKVFEIVAKGKLRNGVRVSSSLLIPASASAGRDMAKLLPESRKILVPVGRCQWPELTCS